MALKSACTLKSTQLHDSLKPHACNEMSKVVFVCVLCVRVLPNGAGTTKTFLFYLTEIT